MTQKKFVMKDWHVPFMLFELSSYAKSKERRKRLEDPADALVAGIHNFFNDDNTDGAMDFFWNNLQIGDD